MVRATYHVLFMSNADALMLTPIETVTLDPTVVKG